MVVPHSFHKVIWKTPIPESFSSCFGVTDANTQDLGHCHRHAPTYQKVPGAAGFLRAHLQEEPSDVVDKAEQVRVFHWYCGCDSCEPTSCASRIQ